MTRKSIPESLMRFFKEENNQILEEMVNDSFKVDKLADAEHQFVSIRLSRSFVFEESLKDAEEFEGFLSFFESRLAFAHTGLRDKYRRFLDENSIPAKIATDREDTEASAGLIAGMNTLKQAIANMVSGEKFANLIINRDSVIAVQFTFCGILYPEGTNSAKFKDVTDFIFYVDVFHADKDGKVISHLLGTS